MVTVVSPASRWSLPFSLLYGWLSGEGRRIKPLPGTVSKHTRIGLARPHIAP